MFQFVREWRVSWTHLFCKVRSRKYITVLGGKRNVREDVELSCPDAPLEAACQDHSW
jgi:hypothetical protein